MHGRGSVHPPRLIFYTPTACAPPGRGPNFILGLLRGGVGGGLKFKPARDAAAGPVEPGAADAKAVPITWAAVIHMIVWVWGSWGKPGSLGLQSQFERALQTQCSACMPDE